MKTSQDYLDAIPKSAVTKEDFLALAPKHLKKEDWEERVHRLFSEPDFDPTCEICRKRLGRFLVMKPRTLVERWIEEAEILNREAEVKEEQKKNL